MMLLARILTMTPREKLGALMTTWGIRVVGCATVGSIAATASQGESPTWFQVCLVSTLAVFSWNSGRDEVRSVLTRRAGWDPAPRTVDR